MMQRFFGFREDPFKLTPDPRFFYSNRMYRRAHDRLIGALRSHKGLAVLIGDAGTGKTILLKTLMKDLDVGSFRCVHFEYSSLTFDDFLAVACHQLSLMGDDRDSRERALDRYLAQLRDTGRNLACLIDEAQNIPLDSLQRLFEWLGELQLRGLTVQILLAGQPELSDRLAHSALQPYKKLLGAQCRLKHLSADEVGKFIAHRLSVSGTLKLDLFTPHAISRISRHTQGVPRLINIVCNHALLIAYDMSRITVSGEVVREVVEDMSRGISVFSGDQEAPRPATRSFSFTPRLNTKALGPRLAGWRHRLIHWGRSLSGWRKRLSAWKRWLLAPTGRRAIIATVLLLLSIALIVPQRMPMPEPAPMTKATVDPDTPDQGSLFDDLLSAGLLPPDHATAEPAPAGDESDTGRSEKVAAMTGAEDEHWALYGGGGERGAPEQALPVVDNEAKPESGASQQQSPPLSEAQAHRSDADVTGAVEKVPALETVVLQPMQTERALERGVVGKQVAGVDAGSAVLGSPDHDYAAQANNQRHREDASISPSAGALDPPLPVSEDSEQAQLIPAVVNHGAQVVALVSPVAGTGDNRMAGVAPKPVLAHPVQPLLPEVSIDSDVPQPPSSLLQEPASEIGSQVGPLLERAEQLFRSRLLTTPPGKNALAVYAQVLRLAPDNEAARHGIDRIKAQYIRWGEKAENRGNWLNATSYYEKALAITPEDTALTASLDRGRRGGRTKMRAASQAAAKKGEARAQLERLGIPVNGKALLEQAGEGNQEAIRLLLAAGVAPDTRPQGGWTPLAYAAIQGHAGVIRLLLEHGARIDLGNDDGKTPLIAAVWNGHLQVVSELLERGANIEATSNNGWTPLMYAAWNGRHAVVRELLTRHARVDVKAKDGWSAYTAASKAGYTDIMALLAKASE